MNYIKRLEQENDGLKGRLTYIRDRLNALEEYLNSDKFHTGHELDGYVNIRDIFLRLEGAKNATLF